GLAAKQEAALATALAIADEDAEACRRIGEHGLELIAAVSRQKGGQPVNILTHCNAGWLAFVDYGSATAPIYAAHRAGIPVHVWVDETRPWLQGARLTAWELAGEGVPHTLITDNAGGHLMQHGRVDLVIVGTDRTTRRGDVANKIGTYLKALAARDNGVPFYVALPSSTFDWQITDGFQEIPIEERSGDELRYIAGLNETGREERVLICPPQTPAANPGFDVTPARLISGLISERGVMRADEADILRLYPERRPERP
ncbi:S-methyl-5-thioribose-1-phosphate isomerase, partial [Desulfurivibrio sp. C05AmB]|uniref:S-methyl-5-thioribose-1-phosphate isomerase n=1 Tax=Desulfurivibrio sp. C05AmB TaxID=3374371 RepID=UPI00376EC186